MKKTLITCALPYANGAIHFGHLAGAYLPADIYARFCRMRGDEVLFLSGSDEYGMAITLSAQMAGRHPQEHVDYFHELNHQLFARMGMSWDHYSRTTWGGHRETVQQFFLDLLQNGYIEERWSEQLYSVSEERFLADRYVVGSCPKCGYEQARGDECPKCAASYEATQLLAPRSKLTGAPLQRRETKHWFLRLELFKQPLLDWLQTKPWKPNVMNFVKGYIEELHARAITRDSDWGIPVPLEGAEGKVLYVWFDAPIGYISAAREWAQLQGCADRWKYFWQDPKTELVQFMGKDNIPFHAVIFPAMIMGQGQPLKLVDAIPANEFYNLEGRKLSKSEGWSIDLDDFLSRYDAEALRYMIAATAPETSDSEFTWSEFQNRVNAELVGKWGNFIHRTLTFVQKMGGELPSSSEMSPQESIFEEALEEKLKQIQGAWSEFKVRRSCQLLMEMAQLCNGYFDAQKPWELLKEGRKERLATVIYHCLKAIQLLALASYPILPSKSQQVWSLLGLEGQLSQMSYLFAKQRALPVGSTLPVPYLLFHKIESEQIEQERRRLIEGKAPAQHALLPLLPSISLEQFQAIDIRCVQILSAEPVPKSSKLLKLHVDLGEGRVRQIISGIAQHYQPDQLLGKKVLCLVNLPKVRLMGQESEGMVLAASGGQLLELPELARMSPGAKLS